MGKEGKFDGKDPLPKGYRVQLKPRSCIRGLLVPVSVPWQNAPGLGKCHRDRRRNQNTRFC